MTRIASFADIAHHKPMLQTILPPTNDEHFVQSLVRGHNYVNVGASTRITCFANGKHVIKALTPKSVTLQMFGSWLVPKTLKDIDWAEDPTSDDVTYDIMTARSLVSYVNALKYARDESGLIVLHLQESTFTIPLILDGINYPMGATPFLIQSQAELVQDRLKRELNSGSNGLKQAIDSLEEILQFIVDLARKGISDESHRFHDSFGWNVTTGDPMITDIGELRFSYGDVYSQIAQDTLHKPGYHDGRRWISEIHPDLGTFLLQRTAELFTLEHVFG
jgi:hypothetical protein